MSLFALDDNAFLEPGAAWIRGERTARFIVQPDAGSAPVMRLQGGAVANTVTLAASGWRTEVALPANDIRDLPLPADALAPAVLSVTSATGFRPSEHAPGSDDLRWLGVYVRWPEPVAPAFDRRCIPARGVAPAYCPIFSVVAPCDRGAPSVSVLAGTSTTGC